MLNNSFIKYLVNGLGNLVEKTAKSLIETSYKEESYTSRTQIQFPPVSVTLVNEPSLLKVDLLTKTKVLGRTGGTSVLTKVTDIQASTLLTELRKPQLIQFKIEELDKEDDENLWEIFKAKREELIRLVKQLVAREYGDSFGVREITFERGCILLSFWLFITAHKAAIATAATVVSLFNGLIDLIEKLSFLIKKFFGGDDNPELSPT